MGVQNRRMTETTARAVRQDEVGPPRRRPGSAQLVGFWQFAPFSSGARTLILAITIIFLCIETYWRLKGDLPNGFRGFAMPVLTFVLIVVLLWHPPSGAIGLAVSGFAGLAIGQGGRYLTAVVVVAGLVVFACGIKMAVAYCGAALAWVAIVTAWPPGLGEWGTIGHLLAFLMSVTLGWSIRRVVQRNRELHRELAAGDERLQAELRAERSRIADELHDIIAHDISVVAMHARVLERTQDPDIRARSQQAIAEAAGQALADTRRVLHLIHRTPENAAAEPADLRGTLEALAQQLRDLGHEVELTVDHGTPLARSIETALVHAAREATTNVLKHAPGAPRIRISLTSHRDTITLEVANDAVASRDPGAPGYGLARLGERAELLGGRFAGGPEGGLWVARMTLPQH